MCDIYSFYRERFYVVFACRQLFDGSRITVTCVLPACGGSFIVSFYRFSFSVLCFYVSAFVVNQDKYIIYVINLKQGTE